MRLKTWFLLLYFFSYINSKLICFIALASRHLTFARDFKSSNKNFMEYENTINIKIFEF